MIMIILNIARGKFNLKHVINRPIFKALYSNSEKVVQAALDQGAKGRTTIAIDIGRQASRMLIKCTLLP